MNSYIVFLKTNNYKKRLPSFCSYSENDALGEGDI
ncbi:hypothetical protein STHERM_c15970 [Spirochaeta thermophila DSM 6192]|uniref:Uncharacterized protein n=1 Tax=Winmispira thermophila (strain ATCC 49972 / DSM 6192 / RI 19.B1) TaxID=665571 RepID=E0RN68_WINT6|nr:hypothetical protein STHERM_c15970 [Spirochaeta thermophila DSM 6192]